jgi:hypothetical protein
MPDKSIREFVRERMHEGNGGRLHLHRVFDATRKAYPRKVVVCSGSPQNGFVMAATCSRSTRDGERFSSPSGEPSARRARYRFTRATDFS